MKQEFQRKFQNQFGFSEASKEVFISSILIEMTYRSEKINLFSQSQTIDSLVVQDCDFQKVFENGTWKKIPLIKIKSIISESQSRAPS